MKKYYMEVKILGSESISNLEKEINTFLQNGWMMRGEMKIDSNKRRYLQVIEYEHEISEDNSLRIDINS